MPGVPSSSPRKTNFELDALLAMDKSSLTQGHTCFHEAAIKGNLEVFQYLIAIFKKRNEAIKKY